MHLPMKSFSPSRRRAAAGLAAGALLLAAAAPARAQTAAFPSKPVVIIAAFPAGGPADAVGRAVGEQMAIGLKQPVVIENRSGATGNIAAQAVARAAPDGHTLLLTLDTSLTANPVLYGSRMGLDVERDLLPVSMIGRYGQMLVVNPGSGIADFAQFVEAARKGLSYASAGNASPGHLTMELLQSLIGGQLNHVPYRGAAPAVQDLLGGQVPAAFVVTPSVAPHVASGRLRALAVSGAKRSPLAPTVPTVAELGHPGATTEFGFVLLTPKGTPEPAVALLHAELRKALASAPVQERLRALDVVPVGSTPAETAAALAAGKQRWARVIRERNIQAE